MFHSIQNFRPSAQYNPSQVNSPVSSQVNSEGNIVGVTRAVVARLWGKIALGLMLGATLGAAVHATAPGTVDEIRARLAPVGQLCRAGDDCGVAVVAGPVAPRSGEEVYNSFCFACHATGVGGAPMIGDVAAWEPRIGKGIDALWGTMQNGLGAMPAKGTCQNCSDEELRASMNFLVDSAK